MKWIKTFENYNSLEEFNSYVMSYLKNYNLTSNQLNLLVKKYSLDIEKFYNNGGHPFQIVDKISKELNLDSDGYSNIIFPKSTNKLIKYL
jgi:hypothetical protein